MQGCTSVSCSNESIDGTVVSYCLGKVANAGVESTFRDAYIDGKLVAGDFSGGASLGAAALNGSIAGAAIGGGAYAAAKALRPTRIDSDIGLSNSQNQGQSTTVDSYNPSTVNNPPVTLVPEEPKHWTPKKKRY